MTVLSKQRLGSCRASGPSGRSQCRHTPTASTSLNLCRRSTVAPVRSGVHRAIIRPVSRSLRCNSQYSSSGEFWQQSCTEQSLEKLLEPYGVQTVTSITNHPEHADIHDTLVVLASILDPEDPECLHELVEDYPELVAIPAQALFCAYEALPPPLPPPHTLSSAHVPTPTDSHALPEEYGDVEAILLAARGARVLPLSHFPQLARLARVFYDVLNTTLPTTLIRTLGLSTNFPQLCGRIRRLATLLSPHAALEVIEEHPQILGHLSSDIEHRIKVLEEVLDITHDQATKAVGKAPAVLMMTPGIIYQRMDSLAALFDLTFGDMTQLFLGEPRVLVQDLNVLTAKWKALATLCKEVPIWEREAIESRAEILVQLARCDVVMLQKLAYEVSDGTRIPGSSSLKELLYLERQFWVSPSELPPHARRAAPVDDTSDDDDQLL